jgi:four helix bundle protein
MKEWRNGGILDTLITGEMTMSKSIPERIRKHTELPVFQMAFQLAIETFEISRKFPKEETYSLTDQIRRASRSVCSNTAEAWRKRRYEAAFVCKLNDAEGEAAETQVWLQFAVACQYVDRDRAARVYSEYDEVISQLVHLIHTADRWVIPKRKKLE